ncbi:MAG: PAS domain-containing sensor histidine kinase [Anaerohalosphaera sp.]|nr:PAS domain-containing sensor histidine kinase [Anaerohalosphaera sp.]
MRDKKEQKQIPLDRLHDEAAIPEQMTIANLIEQLDSAQEKIDSLEKQIEINSSKHFDLMHESVNTIVQNEQTKLNSAIEYLPEGLIIIDPFGNIEKANTSARTLLTGSDNAPIDLIAKALDALGIKNLIASNINSRKNDQGEFRFRSQNNNILQLLWHVIDDDNDKPIATVITLKDMTEEIENSKAKSDFIAAISHELRTPLTSIQNAVSNILAGVTGRINAKTRTYLNTVTADCRRYATLINDLLDTSKLETGAMPLNRCAIGIETIINKAIKAFTAIADEKSIEINAQLDRRVPPLLADPQRIEQVLANLLDNAIKYTPKDGRVTIADYETPESVIITVTDTGTGIPDNIQSRIFEKFYQHHRQAGAGYQGAGLGLAICSDIIKAHGGSLWVESLQGNGCKFSFSIPKVTPAIILNKHLTDLSDSINSPKENTSLIMLKFQCPDQNDSHLNEHAKNVINSLIEIYKLYPENNSDLVLQINDNEMALIILDDKNNNTDKITKKIIKNIRDIPNNSFGHQQLLPMIAIAKYPEETDDPADLIKIAREKYRNMT